MNWISATGFSPCVAMPTDMPAMVASAKGVSCTRSLPKRSCSPAVARNTPPFAPTSCPITTTFGSCCISQPCAIAMASTMVIVANSMTAGFGAVFAGNAPLLVQMGGKRCEQMLEHCIGRWLRSTEIFADRRIDAERALFEQRLFLVGIPDSRIDQKCTNSQQRFQSPSIFDLLTLTVSAGVIRRRVIAQSVCQRFDQTGSCAAPRGLERLAHHLADGEHIVAVDLYSRNACRHRFLRQGLGGGLRGDRHGNGPAIIDDDEYHGQGSRSGQVQRLVEGALGCAAVADVGERAARLLQHLERHGCARCMQGLGGDGHAPGEVVARYGKIVAAFIAAPVGEYFRHGHAAPQLRAE